MVNICENLTFTCLLVFVLGSHHTDTRGIGLNLRHLYRSEYHNIFFALIAWTYIVSSPAQADSVTISVVTPLPARLSTLRDHALTQLVGVNVVQCA